MGEFDSYSLIDFMPMGPEVYFRLFVRHNQALWPAQIPGLILGLVALWSAWRGRGRILGPALGICWLWVGYTFHLKLFAELNWAASYAGWGFVLQGLLLAGWGFAGRLDGEFHRPLGAVEYTGLGLGVFALVAYPLLIPLSGRAWWAVELFGTAPDPTVILTLGLLLLPARVPWSLTVIPILWCALSGAVWWAMSWMPGLLVPALALLFLVAAIKKGADSFP
ncbi:MAG: DUF6064 family protein [Candidatus Competibacteraceae bacterium]|nr:DUF6064 family protein [Candidatus Competibacteraceae bacterium]